MRAAATAGEIVREVLASPERSKLDPGSDREFYAFPRLVKHVDEGFTSQVTELYRQRIPQDAVVLDLCSSWVSHLPPGEKYKEVIGHGMNAQELAKNPQLDRFFVRDLNREPREWALADASVDAVVCCVSVQYLQQPEQVFAEVYRVLKPGGVAIFTFSNRMFWDKG
ncbi:S-adenosyl-L-methionine-dependent methyltransferase [Raphidocelis subcapitata]|uniref:S-adenosyl-L-methionine-dependent methyltransferase n=1 Tax=Raphidocelis subcapitata TaxID=307507 RepID=A0A2V0PJU2_9CHLO|nr:S-adenosyl-L-methionine-dependent methyltransferase [Raphidocelis subcapitata]|eukprot:GBG00069.1 S-adenosyl-L-methionine-dependent methyltransferase [Raphidocelis subcapitata]